MFKHSAILASAFTAFALVAGCSTTAPTPADPVAKRHSIDANVDASLNKLYQQAPATRELVAKSAGVLVFPAVITAGFVVGGSYGEGALRKNGRTTGYYNTAAGSVGLLAGADSKAVFLVFITQDAYDKFVASKGWTAGADASVTVLNIGADGSIDTRTAQQGVAGFVLSNGGLMANLSLEGTKFTRLTL
jgi:lipid-binding SYLF domain-containing protein